DKVATFSNYGKTIDITAPGVNTFTTGFNDIYQNQTGTSFSAPIVSGAAALVWAANPTYTPLQVGEQLRISADPIIYANSASKYANKLGRGRLDIKNALTIESPSVRASKPLLVKDDGNPPDPGQTANLYFDFTNYLKSTSSGLEITISSTSTFLTISKNTIRPGIISENSTIRNTLDPFIVTIKSTTPLNTPIEVVLTFKDGAYSDLQTISFVIPSYIDINENNITTSLSSNGRMGYEDSQNSTNGSGFVYNDENILYEMGLIMGTSSSDLSNSVRSINNTFDQDFTTASKIVKITPGERSYSEVSGTFRNMPTAGTESLLVSYRSLVWKDLVYSNFIILEYKVKNTTANPVTGFYFGIFADWDISLNGGGDRAGWNDDVKLGYAYPAQASNLPQSGIQSLSGNAQYYAIDNDESISGNPLGIYDGYTDSEKFTTISSGLGRTQAGDVTHGNDVSHVVSSGPYLINAGEEITIAFALHGANTYTSLVTSAKYADSLYNFTLKATMPVVNSTEICFGESSTLTATGVPSYNWYRDFTGGIPFYSGASFTTPDLFNDTIFYVSNAANTFESVRTSASVTLKANPAITLSRSPSLCEGESITLQAKEADEYLWSTSETTQSIVVSGADDYSVTVKDNTLSCESTSIPIQVIVNPLPTASFSSAGELISGEPIQFTDESLDASSWYWEFDDGETSIEQSPSHQYAEGGNYSVRLTVTSGNGCQDVSLQDLGIITGLEIDFANGVTLFPNPITQDKLLITIPENSSEALELSVLNTQGKRVMDVLLSEDNENTLFVSDLPSGIYFVKIKSGNSIATKKIVILR
ncbi:MAG TPA: T9SS type A sorting domain-containing protein, partial [Chryseolinea sp.]|nr:T9SS type A sorting domain-containing protein [Chryseolinea sp.]